MDAKDYATSKKYESADREEFKRPSHYDFMMTSELKAAGFSGIRHNSISNDVEIWILGEIRQKISKADIELNPYLVEETWERLIAV